MTGDAMVLEPQRSRPYVPGYTIPHDEEGMRAWAAVSEQIGQARTYWVGTVDPQGQPHAVPIWGTWIRRLLTRQVHSYR